MLPTVTQSTKDYILAHREEDVRQLALRGCKDADVDMQFALQQIDGWQRARTKLPRWAAHERILYPPHISMEQCSSEQTAKYKAQLISQLVPEKSQARIADLTGGFGVDFSYISQDFQEAYYIEQQEHLCHIAEHNFAALGMSNAHVIHGVSEDILPTLPHLDVIYLDPARRDQNGKKTFAISDCTPDVTTLLPLLREKADNIVVKLSPMLDHREAVRQLEGVTEVHILSVKNECKETLLVINNTSERTKIVCVNDDDTFITSLDDVSQVAVTSVVGEGDTLVVPNASLMKAGCFGALCSAYNIEALDQNSHLFLAKSSGIVATFPGKAYRIDHITSMNKHELKPVLAELTHANISVRNFPMSVDTLRKKLKLKEGGQTYIFATSVGSEHRLFFCSKI